MLIDSFSKNASFISCSDGSRYFYVSFTYHTHRAKLVQKHEKILCSILHKVPPFTAENVKTFYKDQYFKGKYCCHTILVLSL